MEFRNSEERREAEIAILTYLPQMVLLYEQGLKELGAKIVKKYVYRDKSGEVDPAYLIEAGSNKFEFRLGNALNEFLSVDREEKPMQFDYRINDPKLAQAKLTRIINGRLAIARAFIECKTPEELKKRLEGMSKHFERLRYWSIDEPQKKGGAQ